MSWWMIVLLVLAVLVLIGCIPVGVDAGFDGELRLSLKIGFIRVHLLPSKPKKPKKRKKHPAARKPAKKPASLYGILFCRQNDLEKIPLLSRKKLLSAAFSAALTKGKCPDVLCGFRKMQSVKEAGKDISLRSIAFWQCRLRLLFLLTCKKK